MSISLKDMASENKQYNFESLHHNRKMDRSIAKENIILLKEIFDKHDMKYWLCFGTLLGAIRDNDFIEHDVDTDIGIELSQLNKLEVSLSDFDRYGFEIIRVTSDLSMISLLRENEYIDIYLFRKVNNDENMSWRCNGYVVKDDYFSELENIHFLGEQFCAPMNYIKYLEEVYGEDWKTPKQNAHAQPINVIEETYKQYYLLLNKWLEMSLNEKTVSELLVNKGISKMIVYGLGNIGKRLIQDIEKSNKLELIGVMDGTIIDEYYGKYKVIKNEELTSIDDIVIIVTPFYYLNFIKEDLFAINKKISIFGINEIIK